MGETEGEIQSKHKEGENINENFEEDRAQKMKLWN